MSNTEKAVTWGLLGFIAWELWSNAAPASAPFMEDANDDNIPIWVKQLSRNNGGGIDFFNRGCGVWRAL
jgi:hypothetical protein